MNFSIVNKLKIQNLSSANDTIYLQNALKKNGIIDIGHAGTALRFLTSYLSIQEGKISILKGCYITSFFNCILPFFFPF